MREIKKLNDLGKDSKTYQKRPIEIQAIELEEDVWINTREGRLKGYKGDWIIQGIQGEIYPCGREIFIKTYFPTYATEEEAKLFNLIRYTD